MDLKICFSKLTYKQKNVFKKWLRETYKLYDKSNKVILLNFARDISNDNFHDVNDLFSIIKGFSIFLLGNKKYITKGFDAFNKYLLINITGRCLGRSINTIKEKQLIRTSTSYQILDEIQVNNELFYKNNIENLKDAQTTLNKLFSLNSQYNIPIKYIPNPPYQLSLYLNNRSIKNINEPRFGKYFGLYSEINTKYDIHNCKDPNNLVDDLGLYYIKNNDKISSVVIPLCENIYKPLVADSFFNPYFCPTDSNTPWGKTRNLSKYNKQCSECIFHISNDIDFWNSPDVTKIINYTNNYSKNNNRNMNWQKIFDKIMKEELSIDNNFKGDFDAWKR